MDIVFTTIQGIAAIWIVYLALEFRKHNKLFRERNNKMQALIETVDAHDETARELLKRVDARMN